VTFGLSIRDAWLIARFELLRAIRTWRAVLLIALYLVAAGGAAYLFSQLIWLFETQLAETLGAAAPSRPGSLLAELLKSRGLKRMFAAMAGDEAAVQGMLQYSPLAILHLWFGMVLAPFFAATTSAETIALDMNSRALRFEVMRTGRTELVMGRYAGQVGLVGLATFMSIPATWGIGAFYMLGHQPIDLAIDLVWLSLRAWFIAMPFVGMGVLCSQLTSSPAWARIMALGMVVGSWVLTGVARYYRDIPESSVIWDVILTLLPQGWMRTMWLMDGGWMVAALICTAMGITIAGMGIVHFRRRDL